jgi:hypothetical protein
MDVTSLILVIFDGNYPGEVTGHMKKIMYHKSSNTLRVTTSHVGKLLPDYTVLQPRRQPSSNIF